MLQSVGSPGALKTHRLGSTFKPHLSHWEGPVVWEAEVLKVSQESEKRAFSSPYLLLAAVFMTGILWC